MFILVIQHIACEPPGRYTPVLERYGEVRSILMGHDSLPPVQDCAAVVIMGGPMGVYEADEYPWIDQELAFLRTALSFGVPCWGVCLGAQFLAAALGSAVGPGPAPEVGVAEITLTPAALADPVFAGLPQALEVLHWHGDTFELPDGATLLASSAAYKYQAFRHGSTYGLQFHLETSWDLAEQWLEVPAYRSSLESQLGSEGPEVLESALVRTEAGTERVAMLVMDRWLSHFVASALVPAGPQRRV